MSHDSQAPGAAERPPANRLGLDYRAAPPRRIAGRIVDVHAHVYDCATTDTFFEAFSLYGLTRVVSMSPVEQAAGLKARYGERIDFIAVPRWRSMSSEDAFRTQWLRDLETFRELGATRMKFWMAPPMRERHGLTLMDSFFESVIRHALDLGYHFMTHIGDPSEWWRPGGKYANASVFGTKRDQYPQLEWLLERVAPRTVIGAHMGGSIEEPEFLNRLLERYPNYFLDTSATKWIIRGVARQPSLVRQLMIRHADRILFGSDLVVDAKYDFDHYASRYWCHQQMWETRYRGESPIEDPDADDPPRLAGIDLPDEVLRRMYDENPAKLGY
ncbi:MAG: amidohydrolase family protein [Phycisphaerales bacterium]|nr:amidohydrolase family protein [Phycisphaerales bacterium]